MSVRVYSIQFSCSAPFDDTSSAKENQENLTQHILGCLRWVTGMDVAQNTVQCVVRTSPTCPHCGGEAPFHFAGCRLGGNRNGQAKGAGSQ